MRLTGPARFRLGRIAQLLGGRDAHEHRLRREHLVEAPARILRPRDLTMQPRRRRLDTVEVGRERHDVEERVEERVANLLHEVGCARVAHKRRPRVPSHDGTRERGGDVDGPALAFAEIHAFVVAAEENERRLAMHCGTDGRVVRLAARNARDCEMARQPHFLGEEVAHTPRIGVVGDDAERGRAEEVLRHRTPQVPERLDRRVLFTRDEGLRVETEDLAQAFEEARGGVEADRRLQIGPFQRLAQKPPEFPVEADVGIRIHELAEVGQMGAERKHHVDFGTDAFDEAADLGKIGGHVEHAVARADDVDARLRPLGPRLARRDLLRSVLLPQPDERAIRALPLVLVDRARQEALDVRAFGRHAAADHLGNGARDNDGRQIGCQRPPGAPHGALCTCLPEFLLGKPRDHDRQFVRRQRVGVVQHRRDGQVLASDGAVDDHLQPLDGGEHVHRPPIAASPVVIENQHHIISPDFFCNAVFSSLRR